MRTVQSDEMPDARLKLAIVFRFAEQRGSGTRIFTTTLYIHGTKDRNVFTQLSPHRRAEPLPAAPRASQPVLLARLNPTLVP